MTYYVVANGEGLDGLTAPTFDYITQSDPGPLGTYRTMYRSRNDATGVGYDAAFGTGLTNFQIKCALIQNTLGSIVEQSTLNLYDGVNERLRFTLLYVAGAGGFVFKLESVNGATLITLVTGTVPFFPAAAINGVSMGPYWFRAEVDYGSTGYVRVYRNQELVLDYTGDPRVGGSTSLSALKLRTSRPSQSNWSEMQFSHLIVADVDLSTKWIANLIPNGAGATSGWTNTFSAVDENGVGNTDYLYTTTLNAKSTFSLSDFDADAINVAVDALFVRSVARAAGVGLSKVAHVVRHGGTDYVGSDLSFTTAGDYQNLSSTYLVNPGTGVAFTRADINALQTGVEAHT